MALTKRTYVDNDREKPITAANLNEIQDEIIRTVGYATCTTTASSTTKVVTVTDFTLVVGAAVNVKFSNTNTATKPYLNVSGTGAKPIMLYETTMPGKKPYSSWKAGEIVRFVYDGTYWIMTSPKPDGWFPGDEITCDYFVCIGFINGSSLYLQVPIDRPLCATDITFSSFRITARLPEGGYLYDGTVEMYSSSGLDITDQVNEKIFSYSGMRIQIVAATGWKNSAGTTLNNIPVVCNVKYTGTFS